MISLRTIEDVRSLPIDAVLTPYITLQKNGANYKACCPFHNEKTPSFNINTAKGFFKCFGCGKSGDGLAFVMEHKGLTFIEAIETIANANGIAIEREQLTDEAIQKIDKDKELMRIMHRAVNIYSEKLNEHPEVVAYLTGERKISEETITEWQIGLAPGWNTVSELAKEKGKIVDCINAGIAKNSNGKTYDTFHDRITVPICNIYGQPISMGGRALPDANKETPKWINGPDTAIYNKKNFLFGLHRAAKAIRQYNSAVLVEGYFDVIKMHQSGRTNTVASLGTALTPEQCKLLKRYCNHVTIMRDGDEAGEKAALKDIDLLAEHGFLISLELLPDGEDPDSMCDKPELKAHKVSDAIGYRLEDFFEECDTPQAKANAIRQSIEWMTDKRLPELTISMYCQELAKSNKIKIADFNLEKTRKDKELKSQMESDESEKSTLPKWVTGEMRELLYEVGFVQLDHYEKPGFHIGTYFGYNREDFKRLTNYTVKPLFFIMDQGNERRMVELNNGKREAVIELGTKAMVSQDAFETSIASRPGFFSMAGFGKVQYKLLANWINSSTRTVYELTSLGYQNEGFLAYCNRIMHEGQLHGYDEYGIVTVGDTSYLSAGVSKLQADVRAEDNIYENDLYFEYKQSPVELKEYFRMFHEVYGEDGRLGIAFILITVFLDIVGEVTKRPIFYSFGPKDSGKSALSESIMWFFFGGKNSEGKLIQGYNLNPGQGTPFSFFSRVKRFNNCAMLFNEYDPNTVEPWKKGAFKSYYDGEGREVGSGDTGKKRKTEIQKWKCSALIVGQYLDTGDEGAVVSRSIINRFSMERNKNRTDEEKKRWADFHELETKGVSSLMADVFKFRQVVKENLRKNFTLLQPKLNQYFRNEHKISLEARLLNNYTLCLAMIKTLENQLAFPFTFDEFEGTVKRRLKMHQELLRDNSIVIAFWKEIEILFDDQTIRADYHIKVKTASNITLKQSEGLVEKMEHYGYSGSPTVDSDTIDFTYKEAKKFLYIRFDAIYDKYAKRYSDKYKRTAPNQDTLLAYLKDQSYFLGLAKGVWFKDKSTSAYVIDYEMLGVELERSHDFDDNNDSSSKNEENLEPPF